MKILQPQVRIRTQDVLCMEPHSQTNPFLRCLNITARCVTHTAFQDNSRQPDTTLQSTRTIKTLTPHSHRCAPFQFVSQPPNLDSTIILPSSESSSKFECKPSSFCLNRVKFCSFKGKRVRRTRKYPTESFQAHQKLPSLSTQLPQSQFTKKSHEKVALVE